MNPNLYIRQSGRVIPAPEADQVVARGYADWQDKGTWVDGRRLTLMTRATTASVGEPVRVIHVFETVNSGDRAYIMGPKPVEGEWLDGRLVTPAPSDTDQPWIPLEYDGATLPAPAVDFNYDITVYTFAESGKHTLQWRLGALSSNVLVLDIVESKPE
jgi:hypothetical protein